MFGAWRIDSTPNACTTKERQPSANSAGQVAQSASDRALHVSVPADALDDSGACRIVAGKNMTTARFYRNKVVLHPEAGRSAQLLTNAI
jgi:hypothetical protein